MSEERCVMFSMRFPQKLWHIVNKCESGAIFWGETGRTIGLNFKMFEAEFLNGEGSVFKTNSVTSFVRQLNLYGFRKISVNNREKRDNHMHEFMHENFRAGRSDLLSGIKRRIGRRKYSSEANSEVEPQKEKSVLVYKTLQLVPLSRLRLCQLALKQALKQAVEQYRMEIHDEPCENLELLEETLTSDETTLSSSENSDTSHASLQENHENTQLEEILDGFKETRSSDS